MNQNTSHNQILGNLTAFLMAFCSICYEILVASRLSRLLGEGIFVYPTVIAIFILFMGLGSARWYRKKPLDISRTLRKLRNIELGLTIAGIFSISGINHWLFNSLYIINLEGVVFGLVIAAVIGFLSGQELPLLFHFCSSLNMEQKHIRKIIFFDYLASFFASLMCTLVFFAHLGFFKTSILISFINLMLVVLIFIIQQKNDIRFNQNWVWGLSVFTGIFLALCLHIDKIENAMLRKMYLGIRPAALIAKEHTPYQEVLLFISKKNGHAVFDTQEEILAKPYKYYIFGLLNGSLQFFLPFDSKVDPNHFFLFDPYLTLHPKVENVLILGGGDGLPARQAVKYPSIKKITMVDLDKEWVELAKSNPFLHALTKDVWDDPRFKVHYMDAFKWVLRDRNRYDLIIVNFPSEPTSLAKIRTLSVQFFRDLKKILSDNGVAVVTSNTHSSKLRLSIQAKTARMAKLAPLIGYYPGKEGTWSRLEHIILFNSEKGRDEFLNNYKLNYHRHLKYRPKRQEDFGMMQYFTVEEAEHYLSFYDPLISRLPFKKQIQLIIEDHVEP